MRLGLLRSAGSPETDRWPACLSAEAAQLEHRQRLAECRLLEPPKSNPDIQRHDSPGGIGGPSAGPAEFPHLAIVRPGSRGPGSDERSHVGRAGFALERTQQRFARVRARRAAGVIGVLVVAGTAAWAVHDARSTADEVARSARRAARVVVCWLTVHNGPASPNGEPGERCPLQ